MAQGFDVIGKGGNGFVLSRLGGGCKPLTGLAMCRELPELYRF
ncbi:protein of unknown function [Magnetospirillum sp. XM-1]|nr:protein of unknown function [Magnetospirillum sp. XM-1]